MLGPKADEARLRRIAFQLIAPIQVAFLRGPAAEAFTGADFSSAPERDAFVDRLVDEILEPPTRGGSR